MTTTEIGIGPFKAETYATAFKAGIGRPEAEALMCQGPIVEVAENVFHVTALTGASDIFEYEGFVETRKAIEEFCLRNMRTGPLKINGEALKQMSYNYNVVNYSGDHMVYVCQNETGKAVIEITRSYRCFYATVMKFKEGINIGVESIIIPFGDSLFNAREEVYENIRLTLRTFFMI